MNYIIAAGQKIGLSPQPNIKGLWLGVTLTFDIYKFVFSEAEMLLLVAKQEISYSPIQYRNIAKRIEQTKNMPCVFYFDAMETYYRDRLTKQGVYFIVGDKYAFIPSLCVNRRFAKNLHSNALLPSAQYILLYHLQCKDLDGMSAKELAEFMPYKYPTIVKSIAQLEKMKLLTIEKVGRDSKRIHFQQDKRDLWSKSQAHLINPIKSFGYIDEKYDIGLIGSYSALSHYSMLNGEEVPTRVLTTPPNFEIYNIEDIQRIEIWKYPPIPTNEEFVDKLSVYLTLKDDEDPRVEKELEIMINNMPW